WNIKLVIVSSRDEQKNWRKMPYVICHKVLCKIGGFIVKRSLDKARQLSHLAPFIYFCDCPDVQNLYIFISSGTFSIKKLNKHWYQKQEKYPKRECNKQSMLFPKL